MLKSSVSTSIFKHFSSSYLKLNPFKNTSDQAYVYVDPSGMIKFLTSVMEQGHNESDVFAASIAEDGWIEFLAVQES